jgi:hypothetical protein
MWFQAIHPFRARQILNQNYPHQVTNKPAGNIKRLVESINGTGHNVTVDTLFTDVKHCFLIQKEEVVFCGHYKKKRRRKNCSGQGPTWKVKFVWPQELNSGSFAQSINATSDFNAKPNQNRSYRGRCGLQNMTNTRHQSMHIYDRNQQHSDSNRHERGGRKCMTE